MAKAQKEKKMAPLPSDPPVETMDTQADLPLWSCKIQNTPKEPEWTVGELIDFHCEGPTVALESSELQFKHPPKAEYELKILSVNKQSDNQLELTVTSYNAGKHNLEKVILTDQGKELFKIEPIILPVKSVIEKPDAKPFGPIAALKMSYPAWTWISILIVVLLTVFFALFRLRRRSQMRKVLEALKEHNTALGAFNQFNKDIRLLSREYVFDKKGGWSKEQKEKYLVNLEQIFRMYMLREFIVPALDWNDRLLIKTISKQDKKYFKNYGPEMKKFLAEIHRAQGDQDKIQVHDCKQLTQMAQKITQVVWKVRRAQK